MPEFPIALEYNLSRSQRIIPHLRIWGWVQIPVFFSVVAMVTLAAQGDWWKAIPMVLFVLFCWRGYFLGVLNGVFIGKQSMEIKIGEGSLEYLAGTEPWGIYLDGLTAVRDLEQSVWTIQHWNGTVINIPKDILTVDALSYLRVCVDNSNEIRDKHGIRNPFPTLKRQKDAKA